MFDRFGEFDTAKEINEAVAAQLAEGDTEAIYVIAEENGIDKEDAEDFIDGAVDELVNPLMAAFGKLKIEEEELKPYEIMEDWLSYIRVRCEEDERMAAAVRKKGKSLKGCIGTLLVWSFRNQHPIDKDILKAAGVNNRCTLGIPGMARAKQIITEYYMGK
ncbi:hypothetical protein AALA79_01885 [Lachnospiraceae bacterium 64-25]